MKWKNLLKNIALAGVNVAVQGPISGAVNEILVDKGTDNSEALELVAAAMDAMEKRITTLEKAAGEGS